MTVVDQVVQFLTTPYLMIGLAFYGGWKAREIYVNWKSPQYMDHVDLVNHGIANKIIAEESIRRLSDEKAREVQQSVQRRLKRSFVGDVELELLRFDGEDDE